MYRLYTGTLHFEFGGTITCTPWKISVVFDSVSIETFDVPGMGNITALRSSTHARAI
jgi:hypothetical protein